MTRLRGFFSLATLFITISLLSGCTTSGSNGGLWPSTGTNEARTGTQQAGGMGLEQAPAELGGAMPTTDRAPVKVALLLPLSGPQGSIGEAMNRAAQLALFDMGFDQFELMPRDTGGSAQSAQRAAQELINDGAKIILGPLLADSVRAVKPIAAPRNIPVIAFSTDWTLADTNTYIMGFMPFVQIARVTEYAKMRNIKTAAYVAPRDSYGDMAVRIFEQEAAKNGISIAARARYAGASDPTLAAQLQTIAQDKTIQAVFIPVGGMKADEISSTLSFHGMTPDKALRMGTGLWDDENLATRAALQGAVFAAPSPRHYAVFEAKYRSVYGSAPPRLASLAYDATALAAVLARQGGAQPYTTQALMNPNGFSGMDGIFRFNRNALVERGLAILKIDERAIKEIVPAPTSFMQQ